MFVASKAQVFIGTTAHPTGAGIAPILSDYTSETWTEIHGKTSIGDFGDEAEVVKVNLIDDGRTYKLKGQRDAGSFVLECSFDDADPGQAALMAANASEGSFAFKIVANNPGATGKSSTTYFRGLVAGCQTKFGTASNNVVLSTKVEINSAPIPVASA